MSGFFEEFVIKARSKHIHHKVMAESLGHYLTSPSPAGVIQRETFEGADVL